MKKKYLECQTLGRRVLRPIVPVNQRTYYIVDCRIFEAYTVSLILGFLPVSTRNLITADQRNQYLPVMEALLKVIETNRPSTQDVNNLLDVTRNLLKETPK